MSPLIEVAFNTKAESEWKDMCGWMELSLYKMEGDQGQTWSVTYINNG